MLKKTTLIAVMVVSFVATEAWGQDNRGRNDDQMQISEESASASESEDADEPFDESVDADEAFDENVDADEAIDENVDADEAIDENVDAASSEEFESNDEPDGDVAAVQDENEEEESDDASVDASEAGELADESGAEADASEIGAWDEAIASDAAMDLGASETSGTPDPVSTTRPAPAPPQVVAAPTPASPPTPTPAPAAAAGSGCIESNTPTGTVQTFDQDPTHGSRGVITWYNACKGFGMIIPDSGGDNVFFNLRSVLASSFRQPAAGMRVRFTLEDGPRGLRAKHVQIGE